MLVVRCLSAETRAVCVREIQKSLDQSVKQLIEDKIKALGVQSRFRVLNSHIEVDNGGRITFQGMQNHTAESIKSLEGYDVAWVEEAQSLSQRSLDLLRPTIRKPGSELWFSWNPSKPTDPVDVLLRGEQLPPDAVVVQANWSENPWFPDELRADMEFDQRRDPEKARHVWGGDYNTASEARVFKNWRVEPFDTPSDAVLRFGADWGFAQDPTALVRCWVEGRTLYVDHEAWKVGCEIDETPALFAGDDAKERWENKADHPGVPGALNWTITADSSRPETVSYMQRKGFKIVPAIKGPGSLEDGIEFLRSYDIVVHPRCKHVADELTHYAYKKDPLTDEVLSVLEDKNNHTIDALRYALEALRRAGKPRPPEAAKPRDRYAKKPARPSGWAA